MVNPKEVSSLSVIRASSARCFGRVEIVERPCMGGWGRYSGYSLKGAKSGLGHGGDCWMT